MNRRTFLKKSLYTCSVLWLGQGFLDSCHVFASEADLPSLEKIINVQWNSKNVKKHNQSYFRMVIDLSGKCEIIKTQTTNYVQLLLKNCKATSFANASSCRNQFVARVEVKEVNQTDSQIFLKIIDAFPLPELRYTLAPVEGADTAYRLTVDIGAFSLPTAIKEANLSIKETNLAFGPLETRSDTDLIVIHHVGLIDEDVTAAKIHEWHLANGWSGIGYHYVIRKNGKIERGRSRDTVGAHAYTYNETSIGINLVGNFEDVFPKEAQLKSAAKLIAVLCHIYNLTPDEATLVGHRDLNDTLCPGKNLYSQLPNLREKTAWHIKNN